MSSAANKRRNRESERALIQSALSIKPVIQITRDEKELAVSEAEGRYERGRVSEALTAQHDEEVARLRGQLRDVLRTVVQLRREIARLTMEITIYRKD